MGEIWGRYRGDIGQSLALARELADLVRVGVRVGVRGRGRGRRRGRGSAHLVRVRVRDGVRGRGRAHLVRVGGMDGARGRVGRTWLGLGEGVGLGLPGEPYPSPGAKPVLTQAPALA